MLRLIWRLGRLVVVVSVLAVGLYLGSPYLLTAVGQYLITEHPLAKADLIVVLSGHAPLRVPEAARVYHEGFAPRILLTNEIKERGLEDLMRLGIRLPEDQEKAVMILEALRVPRSAILTIQERSDSTRGEMRTVARFLKSQPESSPMRSLILVTSKSHTTRAHKIFAAGLGPSIRLIMHPVPNDPFHPARWWRDRTDSKEVLHEYQALLDFWRLELWGFLVGQATAVPPPVRAR